MLAQMPLEHLRHQPVHRAAHCGDLLQHRRTPDFCFKCFLKAGQLPLDAANPVQQRPLVIDCMAHGGQSPIYWYPVYKPESSDVCRSEEHTSELQSLMRISYAVF